ncbi:MAG: hypothetical protein J6D28_02245 [Bacilli bacterium]|nr:hypothetical protein [Bacilli bacterium]
MKNYKKIILGLLTLIITICLTGCGNKTKLTAESFKTKMEENNYKVEEATNQFAKYNYVKKVYIALNENYQIEYYELENEEKAKTFYNNNKGIFEKSKENGYSQTNGEFGNYAKYTLKTAGKYKVVSRIDNTVIYLNADEQYKKEIKEILKTIGY